MTTYSSVRQGRGRSQRRGESRRTGQWKLAYADFLTALMAFFLLMWLTTDSSHAERTAIAAYFTGTDASIVALDSNSISNVHVQLADQIANKPELTALSEHIKLSQLENQLRIDMTDANGETLFATGASEFSAVGEQLLTQMGDIIAPLPLDILIEGHTDAFKTAPGTRSNWEISSARAYSCLLYTSDAADE